MRRSAGLVGILAASAVVVGCGGAKPGFDSAAGWHLLSGHDQIAAARVIYAPVDRHLVLTSPPSRTVASLPRQGTVIWAMVSRGGNSRFPRRQVPLRVEQGAPSNPFEGFRCAPAVATSRCFAASGSVWRVFGRYGQYDVDLYVFFGSDRPLPEQVAAADAELARLRLPHAPAAPRANAASCAHPTGTSYYDPKVSPASGPAGTRVHVSGRLPVLREGGRDVGQTATSVVAYWNLDVDHWMSVAAAHPQAAVAGSPVRLLGAVSVAGACTYRATLTIPAVPAGTYPIEVLSGNAQGSAGFAPAEFRVTSG
jgi:hypothetical protein